MKCTKCNTCNTQVGEKNIDLKNKILFCPNCNVYQPISVPGAINALKESLKAKVDKPEHINVIEFDGNSILVIKPSRLRITLSLIPILIFMIVVFFLGGFRHLEGGALLPFLGSFLLIIHFVLLSSANGTSIAVTDDLLSYSTKRYYKKSYTLKLSIDAQDATQLYVKSRNIGSGSESSTVFDLRVKSLGNKDQVLIEGHNKSSDLFFIEQYIEEFLDIDDVIDSSEIPNVSTLVPSVSDVIKLLKNR